MFWTVTIEEEKRKRNDAVEYHLEPKVFENPVWIRDKGGNFGEMSGIPIARKLKCRLRIKLNESKRVDKKPKRKTLFACSVSYWDFVDDLFDVGEHYDSPLWKVLRKLEQDFEDTADELLSSKSCSS